MFLCLGVQTLSSTGTKGPHCLCSTQSGHEPLTSNMDPPLRSRFMVLVSSLTVISFLYPSPHPCLGGGGVPIPGALGNRTCCGSEEGLKPCLDSGSSLCKMKLRRAHHRVLVRIQGDRACKVLCATPGAQGRVGALSTWKLLFF